ncbi:hypothetical protein J4729_24130 [Leisingera sp. HS039]|uniref:hypothetical protein n=1 Tax=unclassified Leisingera TaxID=2614906 RepID=UPI001070E2D7|nr:MULTISPECIES: hypothetical protein [unclassified Leisingera]MBQ4827592.1 hypothetical protein [Leisingera sp. HS039]QBR38605.1 hypothetical protein ETW23_22150 [Leisingera sp. NJS201]
MTKRKNPSPAFKAQVALEAIREEKVLAELPKTYGAHPNMISGWKRAAVKNMAQAFSKRTGAAAKSNGAEIGKLHSKTGQLVAERGFLKRARDR